MTLKNKTCWILTEGIAGTENQCLGVAEALGVTPVVKRIKLRFPWKQLSPWLGWGHQHALTPDSSTISAPWPDLLIASGRKSIGAALHIKKQNKNKTFLVQIQDPRFRNSSFDLIIVPQHDPSRGDNIFVTTSSLNRVTNQKIQSEIVKWSDKFINISKPCVAVLIGGNSRAHVMTTEKALLLSDQLYSLAEQGIGLLVTASRRTGEENSNILKSKLNHKNIYFWDGNGENPYFAFLGLANYIIVTEDSASMTSDALATGKPVYIAKLDGGTSRFDLMHRLLQEQGFTRPFTGALETWSYAPPNDTLKAAQEIERRMHLKG